MAYSEPTGLFSLIWDEAVTDDMPPKLAQAVAGTSTPHLTVHLGRPQIRLDGRVQAVRPANHFHSALGLPFW
jgi:hypothetical protein